MPLLVPCRVSLSLSGPHISGSKPQGGSPPAHSNLFSHTVHFLLSLAKLLLSHTVQVQYPHLLPLHFKPTPQGTASHSRGR